MDLILWRHAEAEDGSPDDARKLTSKGKKQAFKVAAFLKERASGEFVVLSSPAKRAQETAAALSDEVRVVPALGPGAPVRAVLASAGWPKGNGTVVVVGHQPDLGRTAALLLCGRDQDWSVKKGAAWWFQSRLSPGREDAVLRAVIAPDLL
jgi:phosphohistidine phosphatase